MTSAAVVTVVWRAYTFSTSTRWTFGIRIGAAVADDHEAVVGIGGVANRREHDAARGNACEHQRLDAVGAQDHVEVSSDECAHAVLGDDDVAGPRRDLRVNLGARGPFDEPAGLADGREALVARADLRVAGAEADDDVDDLLHPDLARAVEGEAVRESTASFSAALALNAGPSTMAVWEIHDEQGRGLRVEREGQRHGRGVSGSHDRVPRRGGILGGCPYAPGGTSRSRLSCSPPAGTPRRAGDPAMEAPRTPALPPTRRPIRRVSSETAGQATRPLPGLQRRPPVHRRPERERGHDMPGRPGMRGWRLHRRLRRGRREPRQPRMRFLGRDAGDDRRRVRAGPALLAMFVANTWPVGAVLTVAYGGKTYTRRPSDTSRARPPLHSGLR